LSIPHPGHKYALERIISEARSNKNLNNIHEFYLAGPSDIVGSGRVTLYSPLITDLKEMADLAHEYKIEIDVVINPSCFGGTHLTPHGYNTILWYLNQLNNIGIDSITVAEPYIIELLNDFSMKTVVSCISMVNSPQRARFFENMGADVITLDPDINRDFKMLNAIKKSVSCDLRLMVNEGCLYKCPFRYSHFNLFSHVTTAGMKPPIFGDYYFDKCISIRVRDPEQIIKSPWIRPEDIKKYEEITPFFKITGRANTVSWIVNCMNIYCSGNYDGNLLEILDCPSELRDLYFIDNKKLEGCIDYWRDCDKLCIDCNYCKMVTNSALKVIDNERRDNKCKEES